MIRLIGEAVLFMWLAIPGSDFYEIEFNHEPGVIREAVLVACPSYIASTHPCAEFDLPVGIYKGRVRGCNAQGCGDWPAKWGHEVVVTCENTDGEVLKADLSHDGKVGIPDFRDLIGQWGDQCE